MAKMKLATVSVLVLAALAGPASALDLPFGLGGGTVRPSRRAHRRPS